MAFIEREITATVRDFREWFPIVYLGGPRQSGKTTLLRHLLPELPYASLEDAEYGPQRPSGKGSR